MCEIMLKYIELNPISKEEENGTYPNKIKYKEEAYSDSGRL